MNSQNDKLNILIVGATGALGSLVTKHCLTKVNLLVNILVRDPQKNKELTSQVEKAGGKVFVGDVAEPQKLKGVTKGMHTVIFTLPPFGEKVNVDGQIALIEDAVQNGVQRVVPSEFAENFSSYSREELSCLPILLSKLKVQDHITKLPIKVLNINTGMFLDSFFHIVLGKDFAYWGNPDQKLQLTSYEDTARFVAAAVARPDEAGDKVYVSHDVTVNELTEIYNKVKGTQITPKRMGPVEVLRAKCKELEEQGRETSFLRLFSFFFDEKIRFEKVHNSEYPELIATPVEDLLRQGGDQTQFSFSFSYSSYGL